MKLLALVIVLLSSSAFAKDGLNISVYQCAAIAPFNTETGKPYPQDVSIGRIVHDACAQSARVAATITGIHFVPTDNTILWVSRTAQGHHGTWYNSGVSVQFDSFESAQTFKNLLESGRIDMLIETPDMTSPYYAGNGFDSSEGSRIEPEGLVFVFKKPAKQTQNLAKPVARDPFASPIYAYFKH